MMHQKCNVNNALLSAKIQTACNVNETYKFNLTKCGRIS